MGKVRGLYCTEYDIHDLKSTEQALATREEQLRLFTDNIPEPVVYLDADRKYAFVNESFLQLNGLDRDVVIGKPSEEVIGLDASEALKPFHDRAFAGETLVYEGSSAYHQVAVVDDDGGHRYLKFDDFYESGISLGPPHRGAFPYTDLFHAAPLLAPAPRRALFLGAGGGIGPRAFAAAYPSLERIDVVDVDPLVLDLARRFFFLAEEGPIRVHVEDARMFLRGE
jgi:PAS domain S-box-containing protein